jgi:hypothetical protein
MLAGYIKELVLLGRFVFENRAHSLTYRTSKAIRIPVYDAAGNIVEMRQPPDDCVSLGDACYAFCCGGFRGSLGNNSQ